MLRHVVRLAVATFAVAAAGVVAPPSATAAAHASACGGSAGVTVVVDFHQLRSGGAQVSCDASGAGEYAAAQFADVGHTLTYVQNEPFVCQVDGLGSPQCARTPPANAYWSLWWSDGKSGKWTYSSLGVASLKVPAGGYVALSWQQGNHEVPPRTAATAHASSSPSSSPTSHPTSKPTAHATGGPTSSPATSPTSTAPAVPSGSPSTAGHGRRHHGSGHSKKPQPHHRASQDSGVQASAPTQVSVPAGSGGGSGGLPGWVAPVAVVAVFAVGGTIALLRRKSSGGA